MQRAKAGGEAGHAEVNDPRVVQKDEWLDNEVILQAKSMIARKVVFKNVAEKHWIRAQKDDPVLRHVRDWLTQPKGDKQTLLGYLNRQVPDTDQEAGHQGRDRTLSLLRERFWWPGMGVQVTLSVKNCERCCRYEARLSLPEMVMISATEPLDLVHMDFVGMETMIAMRK